MPASSQPWRYELQELPHGRRARRWYLCCGNNGESTNRAALIASCNRAEALAAKAMNETKQFATVRGRPALELVLASSMESAERPIWVTRLAHICKADRRRWLA